METETINSKKSTVILRTPNSKKSIRQFTEGTVFVRIEFQAEGIDKCKDSISPGRVTKCAWVWGEWGVC